MINVNGVQPPIVPQPIEPASAVSGPASGVNQVGITDVVEISNIASLVDKIQALPDIRTELVERVKAEIAAGTYETPERLEIAVDRLMEELFG